MDFSMSKFANKADRDAAEAAHIAKCDRWNDACIEGCGAPDNTKNPYILGSDEFDGFAEGQKSRMVQFVLSPGARLDGANNCDDLGTGEGQFHGRI